MKQYTLEVLNEVPIPQGSMVGFEAHDDEGNVTVRMRHAGSGAVQAWRELVGFFWLEEFGRDIVFDDVPVAATMRFWLPRPKAAKGRAFPHKRSGGDLDKLCRAVGDALEGLAYVDDSQIVALRARKRYETEEHPRGVQITLVELTEEAER